MKQTAVEWLENEIFRRYKFTFQQLNCSPLEEAIAQAKEMEKQQIIDAIDWGNRKGYDEHRLTCINNEDEQYYNETFKNK